MIFSTDEQTINDLAINGSASKLSITGLFKPATIGGQALLMQLFNRPLADIDLLRNRLSTIAYLHHHDIKINLNKEEVDFIEHYLNQGKGPVKASAIRAAKNAFANYLSPSNHYYVISSGVVLLIKLINNLDTVCHSFTGDPKPTLLNNIKMLIDSLKESDKNLDFVTLKPQENISGLALEKYDSLFRYKAHRQIKNLLNAIYELDVLTAAAQTAALLNFAYPQFTDAPGPLLELEGLFHPLLTNPVTNNITFNQSNHLCFITGANMAGKSTLLKSVGIAVLLAHVGFPVPASAMTLSLFNGLFTTINLSDNINAGHSHFYAEVLRIKEMAINISELGNIVVIFDELFRSTNVKDAHDASLAIIKALAQVKGCLFIISTHIAEVAEHLQTTENIFFRCLTPGLKNNEPVYDYKLRSGVTAERLGMKIINDENILGLLQNASSPGK